MLVKVVEHFMLQPVVGRGKDTDQYQLKQHDFPGFFMCIYFNAVLRDHNNELEEEDKGKEADCADSPFWHTE